MKKTSIKALQSAIAKLQVSSGRKKPALRSRRLRVSRKPVPGTFSGRGPAQPARIASNAGGGLTISYSERWSPVSVPQSAQESVRYLAFTPGASGSTRLDQIAALYEMYRIKKARIHYKPSVGTTSDGTHTMGADYDGVEVPQTVRGIDVLTPRSSAPVYSPGSITIDVSKAMKAKWHYTANSAQAASGLQRANTNAFTVCSALEAEGGATGPKFYGVLWLEYTVEFAGPQPSTLLSGQNVLMNHHNADMDFTSGVIVNQFPTTTYTSEALLYQPVADASGGPSAPTITNVTAVPSGVGGVTLTIEAPTTWRNEMVLDTAGGLLETDYPWLRNGQRYLMQVDASGDISVAPGSWALPDLKANLTKAGLKLIGQVAMNLHNPGLARQTFSFIFERINSFATYNHGLFLELFAYIGAYPTGAYSPIALAITTTALARGARAIDRGNIGGIQHLALPE